MRVSYPNYNRAITNLVSNIMNEFEMDSSYSVLKDVKRLLDYNYTNVILIIYEDLCVNDFININPNSFLGKHRLRNMTKSFPTSLKNTINVLETGNVFRKDDSIDIIKKINSDGKYCAYGIFPEGLGAYSTREEMFERIINLSLNDGKKFIYAYYDGKCSDVEVINSELEMLGDNLEDSIVLITSTGHNKVGNMEGLDINNYPELLEILDDYSYLNSRTMLVTCKDEEKLVDNFDKYLSVDFKLLTMKDLEDKRLLTDELDNFDFDYIIVGRKEKYFLNSGYTDLDGGIVQDEVDIPLFCICRKKKEENFVVRQVTEKDYEDFLKLVQIVQEKNSVERKDIFRKNRIVTRNEMLDLSSRHSGKKSFVYVYNDKILGYIMCEIISFQGDVVYEERSVLRITDIYVLEEYRRHGIGKKLYEEVLKYGKKLHVNLLEFFIWDFNVEVVAFIKSLNMERLNSCYELKLK